MAAEKKRNLGIDILCCVGVIFLLGLQYMDAAGFPEAPLGTASVIPAAVRWLCLSGAAILSAGTGYVLSTKKFSAGYFRILIRLIYVYIVCSLAALGMRVLLFGDTLTGSEALQALLHFSATETGRFAGMYFVLLIAAPYLNAAFHGLKTQNARLSLLMLLAAFSGLQPMLYVSDSYLLPEWCKALFPAAAYIGGAYIRRYGKNRRIWLDLPAILALLAGETALVMLTSSAAGRISCPWLDSMASLPSLGIGLLMLAMLHSSKPGTGSVHRFFAGAASGALSALLLGDLIIDAALPAIAERFPAIEAKLTAGIFAVPVIFILSCVLGLMLQLPLIGVRSYLSSSDAEEEDEEEAPPRRRKRPEIVVPEHTHTEPAKRTADSRHSIRVPVSDPEQPLHLTQPGMETPQGVHEAHLPDQPLPAPPERPAEPEEPEESAEVKVYVPKHAKSSAPEPPRRTSGVSAALSSAVEAAARREHMTVDEILSETPRTPRKQETGTVSKLLNRLSDQEEP